MKPKTKRILSVAGTAAAIVAVAVAVYLLWRRNGGVLVVGGTNTQTNMSTTSNGSSGTHFNDTSLPRGYRNNNPLNVRKKAYNAWKGKVVPGTDPDFEQFITMAHGYRCGLYLIRKYIGQGHDTIRKIVTKWAPPSENNTGSYIANVASRSGIGADTVLSRNDRESLCRIVRAMAWSENGYPPATMDDIYQGWSLL